MQFLIAFMAKKLSEGRPSKRHLQDKHDGMMQSRLISCILDIYLNVAYHVDIVYIVQIFQVFAYYTLHFDKISI